jgi:hypothetical protein
MMNVPKCLFSTAARSIIGQSVVAAEVYITVRCESLIYLKFKLKGLGHDGVHVSGRDN